ncbi:hypothetical protein GQ42DRAFT_159778 [Ramicandelaber brevisporus]|nr:hypothetical protein GQ42DRAFT_159778 [Ramicandelaber brevisporus]
MQSGQSLDEIIRQSEGHGRRRGNGGGNRQSGRSNRSNYTDLDNVDSDNNNNGGGINDDDDGNQMEDIVMSDGQQRRRQPRSPYARNNSNSNNSNSNNKRTLNRNNTGNNNNRSGGGGNSASGRSSGAGGSSGGSKILITNLAYSVTEEDLSELFGEFGGVRQAKLNYDQNGKSLGTATVTFAKSDAAQHAFEKYANVELDSRPMRISIPINPSLAPLPTSATAAAAAAGFPTVMQPMGQIPMLHVAQLPQYPTTIPFTAAHPMSTLSSYGRGNARSSYNNNNNRNSNNNNRNDNRGRNQQSSNRSQRTSNQSHQQRAEQQKSSKTIADLDAELDSYMGNSN